MPKTDKILMAHGSGGQLSHDLVEQIFLKHFHNPTLANLDDAAVLPSPTSDSRFALTTDSYVIHPLFFPGGDIGKLAVCGTVNDLAMRGARPLYLTTGFILEEGLPLEDLERIVVSMATTAKTADVQIVAGDTKVVERGRAIMSQREGLAFNTPLVSDCAPLSGLVATLLEASPAVHCLRDPTRGGLATVLNELARRSGVGIEIEETHIPVRDAVRGMCELLGLDPLYVANEGKLVAVVAQEDAEKALAALRAHEYGTEAVIIGRAVAEHPGRVVVRTPLGARRIVDMLVGEQLPRIC
jgi:hydrogenase expression/formation protein HypE